MAVSESTTTRAVPPPRTLTRGTLMVAAFAVAYLVCSLLSRLALVPGSNISMVWPGAGVAAMWVLARAEAPARWLNYVLIGLLTMLVVALTGGTPLATFASGLANSVQAAAR